MKCSISTFVAVMALWAAAGANAGSAGSTDLDSLHRDIDRLADQVEPHLIANRLGARVVANLAVDYQAATH
jgi:hypothetical protein